MTAPRSEQIDLNATPFYHVISRCVRRSYLCGQDRETGKDYSHRKRWLVGRIKSQSQAFAIDIAAYAIMDNHYHLVLHVDSDRAREWDTSEVIRRWSAFYPNDAKRIQELAAIDVSHPEVKRAVIKWRDRLMSISWYMRTINEFMARQCNFEDKCKGRFWEGRFKSQALLDEGAVLSAMAYVDLNPIRAGMSETPEASDFTSIQERIRAYQKTQHKPHGKTKPQPTCLMAFQEMHIHKPKPKPKPDGFPCLDYNLEDYLQLVDETGRVLRVDKRGAISSSLKPILERVGISNSGWVKMVKGVERQFSYAIGNEENLKIFGYGKKKNLKGIKCSKQMYIRVA